MILRLVLHGQALLVVVMVGCAVSVTVITMTSIAHADEKSPINNRGFFSGVTFRLIYRLHYLGLLLPYTGECFDEIYRDITHFGLSSLYSYTTHALFIQEREYQLGPSAFG